MRKASTSQPLWIDYFRERDTTLTDPRLILHSCGLITLGNEIQLIAHYNPKGLCCGLITLGNEIQLASDQ